MTQGKLEQMLYEAFLHAAQQMGTRVKGMSCFLKNWEDTKVVPAKRKTDKAA